MEWHFRDDKTYFGDEDMVENRERLKIQYQEVGNTQRAPSEGRIIWALECT